MSLSNLVIPSKAIQFPGNDDLVVRGLGLSSIVFLVTHNKGPLVEVFDRVQSGELDATTAEAFAMEMAGEFPVLVAMIIAAGCGEPEQWPACVDIPISIQLELLVAIGELTFSAAGGLEKFVETVLKVVAGAAGLQGKESSLPIGSTD